MSRHTEATYPLQSLVQTMSAGQVERLVSKAKVWKESEHLFGELKEVVQRFMDEVSAFISISLILAVNSKR